MIDLLVINYNTKEYMRRLLEILNSDYEPGVWTLYVADNGSEDGSFDWLAENQELYNIELVVGNTNIGYSAAVNDLARRSKGDILSAINSDTWFTTADMKYIQSTFDDYPDQAVFGPKQINEQGLITHGGIVGVNTSLSHRGWRQYDPNDELFKFRDEVPTVSGSLYFIRRSVWDEMEACSIYKEICGGDVPGPFLPTPHYYEETWFSYHCRDHGHKVYYDGTHTMGHTWAASTGGPSPILTEYMLKSKGIFIKACQTHGIEHD